LDESGSAPAARIADSASLDAGANTRSVASSRKPAAVRYTRNVPADPWSARRTRSSAAACLFASAPAPNPNNRLTLNPDGSGASTSTNIARAAFSTTLP
jgi:hypothetical protein